MSRSDQDVRPAPAGPVLKIVQRAEWEAARPAGAYAGSADDLRDGFIHLSSPAQVAATAKRHFAGRGDLVLVALDPARLGPALRWEPSRGDELFPHLYAPLDMGAVIWEKPLVLDAEGRHVFPAEAGT